MTTGIAQRLPDTSSLLRQRAAVQNRAGALLGAIGGLGGGAPDSPVASVGLAIGEVRVRLDVDVGGLAERLPAAIETVRQAVPAGAVEFVATIGDSYERARALLADSDLARAASSGDLQAVALAVVEQALGLFAQRVAELSGGLVDRAALQTVAEALATFARLRADFAGNRDELLPFLARYLVGVAPDLLQPPAAALRALHDRLAPAGEAALDAATAEARAALRAAEAELRAAVEALNPARAAGYARVSAALDAYNAAAAALLDAFAAAFAAARAGVDDPAWDAGLEAYAALLAAVPLADVPTLDDMIDAVGGALDDLLARAAGVLDPEELHGRLAALAEGIRQSFATSALGQVREAVAGFLDQIKAVVDQIPSESIQQTVDQMLARVGQELDRLGIDRVADGVAAGFAEAERFVDQTLGGDLLAQVRAGLGELLGQLDGLPIAELVANMRGALAELGSLVEQLEQEVASGVDEIAALLAELDRLSFRPVGDAVIAEIDQIKARLAAINPNALSEPEKLAIRGAVALLRAIDLSGTVGGEIKPAYHEVEREVLRLLGIVEAALGRLRDEVGVFSPEALLRPVHALLGQATAALGQVNGRMLLRPLYAEVDALAARLEQISPARLLDPLAEPYAAMLAAVHQIDPARWVEPLNLLYAELDRLIALVDITPLLDELERRRRELFADARSALLTALDDVDLPAPVQAFYDGMRPLLEGLGDAIFGDPDAELRRVALDLRGRLRLSSLFAPLDMAFDELLALAEEAPADDLVDTFNALRLGLGAGLDALDPGALAARLRGARAGLARFDPARTLAGPLVLPPIRAAFEAKIAAAPDSRQEDVAALRLRFEASAQIVLPGAPASRLAAVSAEHRALLAALDRRAAGVDASPARAGYAALRVGLARLLPDFLRAAEPLTYADVVAGLETMRPSARAARLDQSLERFLAQVAPIAAGMEALSNSFFAALRDTVNLINPLTLRDHVAAVYAAIRARLRVIDPAALAGGIREQIVEPLLAPLEALNPALLKERLQALFDRLLATLRRAAAALLDDVAAAVDDFLRRLRAAVGALAGDLEATIAVALEAVGDVLARLEGLVFVEILGRLRRVVLNLGVSFDQELDRVLHAFEAMLDAIPLGDGGSVSVSVSVGAS